MFKLLNFEKLFYTILSLISAVCFVPCLFFPGAKFGALFFGALFVGTGGMRYCLFLSENGGKYANISAFLVKLGRILFILWLISFIIIEIYVLSSETHSYDTADEKDYILVLGAGLNGDKPSLMLQKRLITAENYLKKYPNSRAVLCGGQGANETVSEAVAMYRFLINNDIDKNRLILEDASVNTLQNISHAKTILDNLSYKKDYSTAVISSEFHLFRAKKLMQKAELDAYAISAPTPFFGLRIIYSIREYFSIMGLIFTGQWVF